MSNWNCTYAGKDNTTTRTTRRRVHWVARVLAPVLLLSITITTFWLEGAVQERGVSMLAKRQEAEAEADSSFPSSSASASSPPAADASSSPPAASASSTSTNAATPTVPSGDAVVLPTPFPQAWDSDFGQYFESTGCYNFVANMTADMAFRTCRPFSLLLATSSAFTKAQADLDASNAVVWGTCNPPAGYETCVAQMENYASGLQSSCSADLAQNNTVATEALIGLQSYSTMYQAGCAIDSDTNEYCYIEAVADPNPADLYVYQLGGGLPMPKSATPSCSSCSKAVMSLYADAMASSSDLKGLEATYASAAARMEGACGQGFAQTTALHGSNSAGRVARRSGLLVVVVGLFSFFLL